MASWSQTSWHQQLAQSRTSALLLRLVDNLFALPVLTIPEVQEFLSVTYKSAKNNVDKLVQEGILQQVGDAKYAKTFFAPEILRIIDEEQG